MKTERKQQQIRFDVGTSDYIKKTKIPHGRHSYKI
jgi:hypothetical protein